MNYTFTAFIKLIVHVISAFKIKIIICDIILTMFNKCCSLLVNAFIMLTNETLYTVKMNMLYLINKIVATDYKQYCLLN